MLRYKTETRPGLIALYDIRLGNGAVYSYSPGARMGQEQFWSYALPAAINDSYGYNGCVINI